jgi:FKBP-type peptidyl-prolyl cis-trans isomerase
MANKRERVFALFGAVLFLVTASALTIAVIITLASDKGTDNSANDTSNTKTLQGTKLANFTPITTDVTSLQIIDTKEGTGQAVKKGDTVTVDYTGAVAATGLIFQSSLDTGQPASFPVQEGTATQDGVIKGWADGVPGMKVGGTRRLIIPADQAYGANPPQGSGIPANAALVFDITLHKIGK